MFWDSFDMGNSEEVADPYKAMKEALFPLCVWGRSVVFDTNAGVIAQGFVSKPNELYTDDAARMFILASLALGSDASAADVTREVSLPSSSWKKIAEEFMKWVIAHQEVECSEWFLVSGHRALYQYKIIDGVIKDAFIASGNYNNYHVIDASSRYE